MDDQWNNQDTPLIAPDMQFRQELARSLQDTYQRQRIQRQFDGNDSSARNGWASIRTFIAAFSLLALTFGFGYYVGRQLRKID